jgi:hypothetical protein
MKPLLPKILVALLPYFEGVLAGIPIGMGLAVSFVASEDRKVFPSHLFLVVIAFGLLASISIPFSNFLTRKISE